MLARMRSALCVALLCAVALALPEAAAAVDPGIANGTAQEKLDAAKSRWRATGIRSYRFRVSRICFCGPPTTTPAVITVRRGHPVDPPRRLRRVATIWRLFSVVQNAIDARVDGLTARYGRVRGIPRSIAVDPERNLADEEVGYEVDRFRPL